MNDLIYDPNEKKKWPMRGGHFFLYRYVALQVFLSNHSVQFHL